MNYANKSLPRHCRKAMSAGWWSPVPADAPITHILDLGANVGYFSVFARMRWPNASITAVEPDATSYAFLCGNVQGLFVRTIRAAFGPEGTVSLVAPLADYSSRRYQPGVGEDCVESHPLPWFTDDVKSTDSLLVKMDIEGAEHQLMNDPNLGLGVLRWADAIALECHVPRETFGRWIVDQLHLTHSVRVLEKRYRAVHFVKRK